MRLGRSLVEDYVIRWRRRLAVNGRHAYEKLLSDVSSGKITAPELKMILTDATLSVVGASDSIDPDVLAGEVIWLASILSGIVVESLSPQSSPLSGEKFRQLLKETPAPPTDPRTNAVYWVYWFEIGKLLWRRCLGVAGEMR